MTQEEQNESDTELTRFLNMCMSSSSKIELKDTSINDSFNSYQIRDTKSAISFILNKIIIIGMVKKQRLGYGKGNENAPFVYGYIFTRKDDLHHVGYLAFHNNPRRKNKIYIQIKSLHKDYQGVIQFQPHPKLDINWLEQNQIDALPACKGVVNNEMSNL